MKYVILLILALQYNDELLLVDFNKNSDLIGWSVVDDVVMGGRSAGNFSINEEGHAVFTGNVSLENNGGFSSIRNRFGQLEIDGFEKIKIRLKGDGKKYQFRVKSNKYDRQSYITYFETTGDWQTIELNLADLYPSFRGMELNMPKYPAVFMEEIAFLISNKKAESFHLEIDKISLE